MGRRNWPLASRALDSQLDWLPMPECAGLGYEPLSVLYSSSASAIDRKSCSRPLSSARDCIPAYATVEIAARIAIMTTTIKSSTIVKPLVLFFMGALYTHYVTAT